MSAAPYLRPFVWGQADCCACACDAFKAATGIDPMEPLRGRYASGREALREIRAAGGWRAMCDDLAARAGLVAVTGHAPGRLALVRLRHIHVLGFGVASGWMIRLKDGLAIVPAGAEVIAWQS